ncbi:hypothetical protein FOB64_006377 [Candida albicans]|uniref:Uncharacterized protein n=1 Tax=Candida albicans TaxID=5476 RepID=A0A8H6BTK1_CANAX|nr:hypothetical protein FOB64_006377 [Candida albicans]
MPVPTSTLIKTEEEERAIRLAEQQQVWERQRLEFEERRRRAESQRIGSPFKHPWWTAFTDAGPEPRCLDEWLTVEISNSIREKPDWKTKYKNEEIVTKWKREIKEQCQDKTKYLDQIIDYVFKELQWYEDVEKDLNTFQIGCDYRIAYSDGAVNETLKKSFSIGARKLVESFGSDIDYHPGSHNQVIDLVHPSLYIVQYDKTPVLKNGQLEIVKYGEQIEHAKPGVDQYGVSKRFQWIPALMTKNSNGKFEFGSYINNLHPIKYKDLYDSISDIFNATVPGLNCVLTRYASQEFVRIPVPRGSDAYTDEYHKEREELDAVLDREAEETGNDYDWERMEEFEKDKSKYLCELIPAWEQAPVFDKPIDLSTFENLKVIVKLANIELTPENPSYAGGSWHVEGGINEDIIATVLYYYDIENITESRLSFRTGFDDPNYEQGDDFYTETIFGIKDEEVMVREIGGIEAKEDRVVVFPNMFQHHVDPFELKDKTKPGHRKILCFFIVDPYNHNVISTDNVPPQQKEWWDDSRDESSWPMTLEQAKEARVALMDERSAKGEGDEFEGAFTRSFSLCEH